MLATAGRGIALACRGVAGAVIVDVHLFLDLADHRAPAREQAIRPEKAKLCLERLGFLALRPSITPCTRSHNSIGTKDACWPGYLCPFHSNAPV